MCVFTRGTIIIKDIIICQPDKYDLGKSFEQSDVCPSCGCMVISFGGVIKAKIIKNLANSTHI